ncbi:RNA ligase family protein [Crossiella cryophila]|uniref:ATP-dependent RNA circularization protein (DNA/RNA ligase family) n=1 Tax=Crossiella cryophila TaxID=43355 RepID=A0A7W7C8P1_9PSEU|nr:RNA ligase family protein [Crossiella cryophila]MBB4676472.1 ATP-dependent RNA circularization protein (DNA/RNA ligase family) [Crossiella cryophila]
MLRKYPRTPHLEGSRLQPGDHDLAAVGYAEIAGRHLVVEEKLDGANAAISFTAEGEQRLQSRGHYLTGGPRERQFDQFKSWAAAAAHLLWPRLTDRYVLYGEWLYAKHTVYYDRLPHYFCEFDALDRHTGVFLSTTARRALLDGLPVCPVPVLHTGPLSTVAELTALLGPSTCGPEQMEGLYIKVEQGAETVGRYKWVRPSFLTEVLDSGGHWLDRPITPNRLADPEALYAGL